eukprot:4687958-Amphidinium_carterae.1
MLMHFCSLGLLHRVVQSPADCVTICVANASLRFECLCSRSPASLLFLYPGFLDKVHCRAEPKPTASASVTVGVSASHNVHSERQCAYEQSWHVMGRRIAWVLRSQLHGGTGSHVQVAAAVA